MSEQSYKAQLSDVLQYAGMGAISADACTRALMWRGKQHGFLKRKIPTTSDQEARGAWLAMMIEANPLKVVFDDVLMLSDRGRMVHDEVSKFADNNDLLISFGKLDYDRVTQEQTGSI